MNGPKTVIIYLFPFVYSDIEIKKKKFSWIYSIIYEKVSLLLSFFRKAAAVIWHKKRF